MDKDADQFTQYYHGVKPAVVEKAVAMHIEIQTTGLVAVREGTGILITHHPPPAQQHRFHVQLKLLQEDRVRYKKELRRLKRKKRARELNEKKARAMENTKEMEKVKGVEEVKLIGRVEEVKMKEGVEEEDEEESEDEWGDDWVVNCSCGVTYDDGGSMCACETCGVDPLFSMFDFLSFSCTVCCLLLALFVVF
jgi:hypothetical protein